MLDKLEKAPRSLTSLTMLVGGVTSTDAAGRAVEKGCDTTDAAGRAVEKGCDITDDAGRAVEKGCDTTRKDVEEPPGDCISHELGNS